ncbi:MAG: Lrp/AsnC family transcriptional regulator, partial [Desulfocucumaceae bacterium]
MKEILDLLESNAKLTENEIAIMLSMDVEEVRSRVKELERNKTILRYITLVNWEKVGEEKVSAVIEVRTT